MAQGIMIELTGSEQARAVDTEIIDNGDAIGTFDSLVRAGQIDPYDPDLNEGITRSVGTIQRTVTDCKRYHITTVTIPIRMDSSVRCSDTQAIYCALHRLAAMLEHAEVDHAGIRKEGKEA